MLLILTFLIISDVKGFSKPYYERINKETNVSKTILTLGTLSNFDLKETKLYKQNLLQKNKMLDKITASVNRVLFVRGNIYRKQYHYN